MEISKKENFSVLLSVYFKETSDHLKSSLHSVLNQTLMPDEIVLVKDGPLTDDLDMTIQIFLQDFPELFKIVELKNNVGLGTALNEGLKVCKNDIIARMDTDDICFVDRFEKQFHYLKDNPDISVIGSNIEEFDDVPGDLNRYRKLPLHHNDLYKFAKYRNPLNHPTVFFRKEHILKVGSYLDMPLFEDYFLWIRLLKEGYQINNLPDPLLHFRVGNDMVGRRQGLGYAQKEFNFLKKAESIGFINKKELLFSLSKLPVRMLPKKVLEVFYKKVLR